MEFCDLEEGRGEGGERIAFGILAKGLKKYGSTTTRLKRDHEVEYIIQRGDTLQGIAVKFGITTGELRRANQLWTNDSIFLRDKLLIPNTGAEEQTEPNMDEEPMRNSFPHLMKLEFNEDQKGYLVSQFGKTLNAQ